MARTNRAEIHHPEPTAVDLLGLDHVALAVADTAATAAFLTGRLELGELEPAAGCVRVGAGAGAAHVRLTAADGPREQGALERLILRVGDLERAVALLGDDVEVEEDAPDLVTFDGPEGLRLGFAMMAGGGIDYDVDRVVLQVADVEETRAALAELGCVPRGESLHVADKQIVLRELPASADRPLLHHIALRVGSVGVLAALARWRGLRVDEDADDGGVAIVLPGPDRIRLHFVEAEPRG